MDNTPSSKLIRNIFFSFAEFERDMIVERTQEGKAIAKTKSGFKEGRPKKYTEEQLRHAIELLKDHSYLEVERMTRISKSTLIRHAIELLKDHSYLEVERMTRISKSTLIREVRRIKIEQGM